MNELEAARGIINEVDCEMAKLFEKRMKASELVAKYKKEHGLSILDTSRENEVVNKNSAYIEDEIVKEYYVEFLKNTMSISRSYQARLNEGMRVAYSGVEGAFAHIASKRLYPEATYVSYKDFESAYSAVENGECDVCVLPIENSYAGDVSTVMDLLFSGSLYVNQVLDLEINHCLIANEGATKDDIKKVISHPQALAQCSEYINKHGYEQISYQNTALAAKFVKESNDKEIAAIASDETAKIFGLNILESKINSSRNNTTRFVAFSRALNLSPNDTKRKMNEHFMLVFTVKNEAGALAKTIDIIGAHRYNMRNLRSRPMKELLWNYYFFVEADGNINTQNGKDMLRELGATCDRLKLVGTYHS
ncbi:MAG: chorismate mutase [Clostridia bacterium]|nr:chorismate mutase [Clostridia bacterium]